MIIDDSLKATLTSNTSSDLVINVQGASTVDVLSNEIKSVDTLGGSTVSVQADSVTDFIQVEGASNLYIDGSFSGSGSVGGASTLTITGDISGDLSNDGASTISANTISGDIGNSGATVNAASCDNVENEFPSSCNIRDPPTVNVDVSPFDAISTSTSKCMHNGSSTASLIAAAGATTLVAFLLV